MKTVKKEKTKSFWQFSVFLESLILDTYNSFILDGFMI